MSGYEDEVFAKEWEVAEKSRHTCVLEEVKLEYRSSPRSPTRAEAMVDLPYSLKIPRAASRPQEKPQGRLPQM